MLSTKVPGYLFCEVRESNLKASPGWTQLRRSARLTRCRFSRGRRPTPESIYTTPEGEAEILALYDEALAGLGPGCESLTVGTRLGDTHVLAIGAEDASSVVFLPGANALNPTCLKWFLPLAERHRLYAPDIVGQPGRSAQERPSPKGDGHAFWVEDVLDGLGLERAPLVGLSYGAAIAIRTMGVAPDRVCGAALVSPAGIAASPFLRILFRDRRPHAPLPPAPYRGASEARGNGTVHGARGPRLRPRYQAARGRPPAPQAGRRPPPDGHRGGARGLRWACGGVCLRGRTRSFPPGRSSRGRRRSSLSLTRPTSSKAAATSLRRRLSVG